MLSREDRERLKVLHEVRRGHITQGEGGRQLGVSERRVRKLLGRVGKEGDAGSFTDCAGSRRTAR